MDRGAFMSSSSRSSAGSRSRRLRRTRSAAVGRRSLPQGRSDGAPRSAGRTRPMRCVPLRRCRRAYTYQLRASARPRLRCSGCASLWSRWPAMTSPLSATCRRARPPASTASCPRSPEPPLSSRGRSSPATGTSHGGDPLCRSRCSRRLSRRWTRCARLWSGGGQTPTSCPMPSACRQVGSLDARTIPSSIFTAASERTVST
mmetsp:Transcript_28360/g.67467  ORF Transcript_28360/g.67467 Transcript_28360/m.67467 type:complete len:202 (+) Transcript_28360:2379-2984(+)